MLRVFHGCRLLAAIVAGSLAMVAGEARGAIINFSTSGRNQNINLALGTSATLFLDPRSNATVDLTPGVPTTVTLNSVSADVTPVATDAGSANVPQTITINTPGATPTSRSFSQLGSIATTVDPFEGQTAAATLGSAGALTFTFGSTGTLTITPLGGGPADVTSPSSSFSNQATFLLTGAIPEPAVLPLMGAAGLALMRRRRGR